MTGERGLAARTVRGVVAGMVTATAAATVVGFWLSYAGLHTFAARAGLTGPESWAWPASVDLFIAAGEAGVTISALRRRRDPLAWVYLGLGFATSVAGNVLHVDTGHLPWARYAVAAVPPMAAMLALAALLRHVYQLALEAHLADTPGPAAGTVPADVLAAAETCLRATVAAGNPLSQNQMIDRFRLTRAQATRVRQTVLAEANGHRPAEAAGPVSERPFRQPPGRQYHNEREST